MMSALTHDSRYERLLDGEGGKPEDMCEVLDRVEERGKLLGRQEGREEGRQEGIDETRLNSIRSVMKSFAVSAQKAMEVLEIPASEWDRYYSKL